MVEVYVAGNVYNSDKSFDTMLQMISREAVRSSSSSPVIISSSITVNGHLSVDNVTMKFDQIKYMLRTRLTNPSNTENRTNLFDPRTSKEFANLLVIDNNLIVSSDTEPDIAIVNFNEHTNLRQYFDSMTLTDREQSVSGTIIFSGDLNVDNITVAGFVDNNNRSDVNTLLAEIFNFRQNRIERLYVDGDANFPTQKNLTIDRLNTIDLSKYLGSVIMQSPTKDIFEIVGRKTFSANLNIIEASVSSFNREIFVDHWITDSLRSQASTQGLQQTIEGSKWQISTLMADNLIIKGNVNGVTFPINDELADSSDVVILTNSNATINIRSAILFTDGIRVGSNAELSTNQPIQSCDVRKVFGDKTLLSHRKWNSVVVNGNATVVNVTPSTETKSMSEFFSNAILLNSDQTMNTAIVIQTNKYAKIVELIGDSNNPRSNINNIKIETISADVLTKSIASAVTQSITIAGKKTFTNEYIQFNGAETALDADLRTPGINGVDVKMLSENLIRRQTPSIRIKKTSKLVFYQPIKINKLFILSNLTINGTPINDIVSIENLTQTNRSVELISFIKTTDDDSLNIIVNGQFQVNLINGISLNFLLENRVRKFSESSSDNQLILGHLTFDNLVINGPSTKIDKINDILCEDVVICISDNEQQITGLKEIIGETSQLHIQQPFHAWKINGIEILSGYSKTIFLSENRIIDQLVVNAPYQIKVNELRITSRINGLALPKYEEQQYLYLSHENETIISAEVPSLRQKRLNYIAESNDFHIEFDQMHIINPENRNQTQSIIFSVDSFATTNYRDGNSTVTSICPVQYHVQSNKINDLLITKSKIGARLIKTSDDDITIHIATRYPDSWNYYNKCNVSTLRGLDVYQSIDSIVYINSEPQLKYPFNVIESIHTIRDMEMNQMYLILHFHIKSILILRKSLPLKNNELWKEIQTIEITDESDSIVNVKLLKWHKQNYLIISSSSETTSELSFYRFNQSNQTFNFINKMQGDFDIIETVEIQSNDVMELHLILGKQMENNLLVLKVIDSNNVQHLNRNTASFQFAQQIHFDAGIESICTFSENGNLYPRRFFFLFNQ